MLSGVVGRICDMQNYNPTAPNTLGLLIKLLNGDNPCRSKVPYIYVLEVYDFLSKEHNWQELETYNSMPSTEEILAPKYNRVYK